MPALPPDLAGAPRRAGRLPLHPRRPRADVRRRPAVDHAPVRRLRHRRGQQRALPPPARPGRHRALGGLRPADATRPGPGRPARARRGRARRGVDRDGRRPGDALRGHPARGRHDLDDDQRAGGDAARAVHARGRAPGGAARGAGRHRPERRAQGVRGARHLHLPAGAVDAPHGRPDALVRRSTCPAGTRSASAGTTCARRAAPRPRRSRSPSRTPSPTCARRQTRGSTSTRWRRGSRSSSPATATCSRRSPSSAPPVACGRTSRATCSAPREPRSQMLRFHTQTGGSTLTAQQPLTNVVRTAFQALAAVLGGTQSLHTNGFDEALGLPTEASATLALRTQQVLAFETGVPDAVDPLAGSVHVEALTDAHRGGGAALVRRGRSARRRGRRDRGGLPAGGDRGGGVRVPEGRRVGRRVVVGVNRFADDAPVDVPVQALDPQVETGRGSRPAGVPRRAGRRGGVERRRAVGGRRARRRGADGADPRRLPARATLGEVVRGAARGVGRARGVARRKRHRAARRQRPGSAHRQARRPPCLGRPRRARRW